MQFICYLAFGSRPKFTLLLTPLGRQLGPLKRFLSHDARRNLNLFQPNLFMRIEHIQPLAHIDNFQTIVKTYEPLCLSGPGPRDCS